MSKGNDDLERNIRDMRRAFPGTPISIQTFDDVASRSDKERDGGEGAMVNLVIGTRGELTRQDAAAAAQAWRKMLVQYPKAIFYVCISGYDTDPREIWDIPEASRYFCRWAKLVGLDLAAALTKSRLEPNSQGTIAKCGAVKDIDPESVGMATFSQLKH